MKIFGADSSLNHWKKQEETCLFAMIWACNRNKNRNGRNDTKIELDYLKQITRQFNDM